MISKEMIRKGLDNGIVKLIDSPNDGESICQVGDHWFYYAGAEGEGLTSAEYVARVPRESIVEEILSALEAIRDDLDPDEYAYYESVLKEAGLDYIPKFQRTLELTIRLNKDSFEVDVYEPESGEVIQMQHSLSFDEHPEFNAAIGNEIYSWLSLWSQKEDNV